MPWVASGVPGEAQASGVPMHLTPGASHFGTLPCPQSTVISSVIGE